MGGNDDCTGGQELSVEEAADVLADRRRRTVADVAEREGSVRIDTLVEEIVPESAPGDARRRAEIDLVHNHLPRLAAADVVEFDDDRVRYCGGSRLEDWLALAREQEPASDRRGGDGVADDPEDS